MNTFHFLYSDGVTRTICCADHGMALLLAAQSMPDLTVLSIAQELYVTPGERLSIQARKRCVV